MEKLRRLSSGEAEEIYGLVLKRLDWMEKNGLHHWNDYDYTNLYPLSYYREKCARGEVYALEDTESGNALAAAVILEADSRWEDTEKAYYIHNFASAIDAKGAGGRFVHAIEDLGREQGKTYVRLDVLKGYKILQNYYESMGYEAVGECRDGSYRGILREKKIVQGN